VADELFSVMLCEKFGWTYEQLQNQPWWFAEIVKVQSRVDAEKQKKEMRKNNQH